MFINIFISVCPPFSPTLYDTIILPHIRYEKFFLTQLTMIMYYTVYYSTLLSSPLPTANTLLHSTLLYSIVLHCNEVYHTLFSSFLRSSLVYSILFYFTPLNTFLQCALLQCALLLYFTLLPSEHNISSNSPFSHLKYADSNERLLKATSLEPSTYLIERMWHDKIVL